MQRHSWEQGTAMQAFLEAGDMDTVIAMAFEAVYRSAEDGRTAVIGVNDAITDPCSVGEALVRVCELTQDPLLQKGLDGLLTWALKLAPRNKDGILYHLSSTREFWADSFYMLPPFLAAAGYPEEAMKQWNGYWNTLFDPQANLLCHMWNDETQSYTRDAHWGTGSGWTLAAIVRMLRLLKEDTMAAHRESLIQRGLLLLDGVLNHLRPDGYFHDVADDPDSFLETNLSQMTAYTIYSGMADGWLPETYETSADLMRNAAQQKMNAYGFVRDVCGAPTFDKPGYSPEGQAFYILMETAAANWHRRKSAE